MGRTPRPFMPGATFHLMARTLRQEHRFTPRVRTAALGDLADVLPRSGCRLLAVAIMSNHLHVVVQQGGRHLKALMQPFLRRLAHRIQRAHDLKGPVFWRPYAAVACMSPGHGRNAIVYVNLNPVRAGICRDPAQYPWTSHALYADPSSAPPELDRIRPLLDPLLALPLFASSGDEPADRLRELYHEFIAWQIQIDQAREEGEESPEAAAELPAPLPPRRGAAVWPRALSPLFHAPLRTGPVDPADPRPRPAAPDLAELARTTLGLEAPGVSLDHIVGRQGGRPAARLRHAIVRRAHAAGYRNVDIARFLGLSESAVSAALCRPRRTG